MFTLVVHRTLRHLVLVHGSAERRDEVSIHVAPGAFDLVASEAIGLVRVDGQAGVEQSRCRFEVVSPGLHEARVAAETPKQRNVPLGE